MVKKINEVLPNTPGKKYDVVSTVLASQDMKQYSQNNVELLSISEAEETIINSHIVENVKEGLQYLTKAGALTESCRNVSHVGTALVISSSSKQLGKVSSVAKKIRFESFLSDKAL